LKPFWALPLNPELVRARLNKCVTTFCSSLIALLLGKPTGPNPLLAGGTTKKQPKKLLEVPSGSDSDKAKQVGKEEDNESDSFNYSTKGDGVVGGKDGSQSNSYDSCASDSDDSSDETASGCPRQDTTKTEKATSMERSVPTISIVMDTEVNTVVSALDEDAAIPRPTPTTIPMKDAAFPAPTTTKIPMNAAVTQSPLVAPVASVLGERKITVALNPIRLELAC
jgi:hypothetical protein